MFTSKTLSIATFTALALGSFLAPASGVLADSPTKPTLYIIGDSTVHNPSADLKGWGDVIGADFDSNKINVENDALGGRSSRTFLTEGHWDPIKAKLKSGDFVLMQFGHNDGGAVSGDKATGRATLKGIGDETQDATDKAGQPITVHTYGWYMKRYAEDAKAKGGMPILVSPIPRNMPSADGKYGRTTDSSYGGWASAVAKAEGVPFIDLNNQVAAKYDALGFDKVKAAYFPGDHTHTSPAGALLNATSVVECLKALPTDPLAPYLLPTIPTAADAATPPASQ